MTQKMLECVRPNGEKLIIPAMEKQPLPKPNRKCPVIVFREVNGEFVKEEYVEEVKRQTHTVITDEIPGGMRCMACRRIHTSKSEVRKCYRNHKMIEVGNESLEIKDDREWEKAYDEKLEDDIAWAFNALKYNEAPIDELTRERCKILDRQIAESGDNRLRSHDGKLLIDGRE